MLIVGYRESNDDRRRDHHVARRQVLRGCLAAHAVAAVPLRAGALGIDVINVDDRTEAHASRLSVERRLVPSGGNRLAPGLGAQVARAGDVKVNALDRQGPGARDADRSMTADQPKLKQSRPPRPRSRERWTRLPGRGRHLASLREGGAARPRTPPPPAPSAPRPPQRKRPRGSAPTTSMRSASSFTPPTPVSLPWKTPGTRCASAPSERKPTWTPPAPRPGDSPSSSATRAA